MLTDEMMKQAYDAWDAALQRRQACDPPYMAMRAALEAVAPMIRDAAFELAADLVWLDHDRHSTDELSKMILGLTGGLTGKPNHGISP
jgi:hypothetical protein